MTVQMGSLHVAGMAVFPTSFEDGLVLVVHEAVAPRFDSFVFAQVGVNAMPAPDAEPGELTGPEAGVAAGDLSIDDAGAGSGGGSETAPVSAAGGDLELPVWIAAPSAQDPAPQFVEDDVEADLPQFASGGAGGASGGGGSARFADFMLPGDMDADTVLAMSAGAFSYIANNDPWCIGG